MAINREERGFDRDQTTFESFAERRQRVHQDVYGEYKPSVDISNVEPLSDLTLPQYDPDRLQERVATGEIERTSVRPFESFLEWTFGGYRGSAEEYADGKFTDRRATIGQMTPESRLEEMQPLDREMNPAEASLLGFIPQFGGRIQDFAQNALNMPGALADGLGRLINSEMLQDLGEAWSTGDVIEEFSEDIGFDLWALRDYSEDLAQQRAISAQAYSDAAGIYESIGQTGTNLAALMMSMKFVGAPMTGAGKVKGADMLGQEVNRTLLDHVKMQAASGFAMTEGEVEDRLIGAGMRVGYNITPYIAQADLPIPGFSGATGLRAIGTDFALNAALTSSFYRQALDEAGGLNMDFFSMAIPQLVTDLGMAMRTRGLPQNIALEEWRDHGTRVLQERYGLDQRDAEQAFTEMHDAYKQTDRGNFNIVETARDVTERYDLTAGELKAFVTETMADPRADISGRDILNTVEDFDRLELEREFLDQTERNLANLRDQYREVYERVERAIDEGREPAEEDVQRLDDLHERIDLQADMRAEIVLGREQIGPDKSMGDDPGVSVSTVRDYMDYEPVQNMDANVGEIQTDLVPRTTVESTGFRQGDIRVTEGLSAMSVDSSSGHLGTGTYFFGSNRAEGFDRSAEDGTTYQIDLTDYNMFRPSSADEARQLHKGLKYFNRFAMGINKDVESREDWKNRAIDNLMNLKDKIAPDMDMVEFRDYLDRQMEGTAHEVREVSFEDYGRPELKMSMREMINQNVESASTRLMREFGYEGVDNRGIEGWDNSRYGSVIYDDPRPERTAEEIFEQDTISNKVSHEQRVEEATPSINLATASVDALADSADLPGVGRSIAREIVEYRQREGIDSVEDLMNVTGIAEGKFSDFNIDKLQIEQPGEVARQAEDVPAHRRVDLGLGEEPSARDVLRAVDDEPRLLEPRDYLDEDSELQNLIRSVRQIAAEYDGKLGPRENSVRAISENFNMPEEAQRALEPFGEDITLRDIRTKIDALEALIWRLETEGEIPGVSPRMTREIRYGINRDLQDLQEMRQMADEAIARETGYRPSEQNADIQRSVRESNRAESERDVEDRQGIEAEREERLQVGLEKQDLWPERQNAPLPRPSEERPFGHVGSREGLDNAIEASELRIQEIQREMDKIQQQRAQMSPEQRQALEELINDIENAQERLNQGADSQVQRMFMQASLNQYRNELEQQFPDQARYFELQDAMRDYEQLQKQAREEMERRNRGTPSEENIRDDIKQKADSEEFDIDEIRELEQARESFDDGRLWNRIEDHDGTILSSEQIENMSVENRNKYLAHRLDLENINRQMLADIFAAFEDAGAIARWSDLDDDRALGAFIRGEDPDDPARALLDNIRDGQTLLHELGHLLESQIFSDDFMRNPDASVARELEPGELSRVIALSRTMEWDRDKSDVQMMRQKLDNKIKAEIMEVSRKVMRPGPSIQEYRDSEHRSDIREGMADLIATYLLNPGRAHEYAPNATRLLTAIEQREGNEMMSSIRNNIHENIMTEQKNPLFAYDMWSREDVREYNISDDRYADLDISEKSKKLTMFVDNYKDLYSAETNLIDAPRLISRVPQEIREFLPFYIEETDQVRVVETAEGRQTETVRTYEEMQELIDNHERSDEIKSAINEARFRLEELRMEWNKTLQLIDDDTAISFIHNYAPRMYENPERAEAILQNRVVGPTDQPRAAQEREWPTLAEAMEAGLRPQTTDLAQLMAHYSNVNAQAIANRNLVDQLGDMTDDRGNPVMVTRSERNELIEQEDSGITTGDYIRVADEAQNMIKRYLDTKEEIYMRPEVYDYVDYHLTKQFDNSIIQGLDNVNKLVKSANYFFNFFHAITIGVESTAASFRPSMLSDPLRDQGGDKFHETILPHKRGLEELGQSREFLRTAIMSGLQLHPMRALHHGDAGRLMDGALRKVENQGWLANKLSAGARKAGQAHNKYQEFLWSQLYTGSKLNAFHGISRKIMKNYAKQEGVDPRDMDARAQEEILENTAFIVNQMFGGQKWAGKGAINPDKFPGRISLDAKTEQLLGMFIRAPDWTWSNINIAKQPIQQGFNEMRDWVSSMAKGERPQRLKSPDEMTTEEYMDFIQRDIRLKESMKYWTGMLTFMGALINGINYMTTGNLAFQNPEGHKWDIDVTDQMHWLQENTPDWIPVLDLEHDPEDQRRYYVGLGKQFKEVARMATDPVQQMGYKLSPITQMTMEQFTGHQTGSQFPTRTARAETMPQEVGYRALDFFEMALPFSFRGGNFAAMAPMYRGMSEYATIENYRDAYQALIAQQVDAGLWQYLQRAAGQVAPFYEPIQTEEQLEERIREIDSMALHNGIDPLQANKDALANERQRHYSNLWRALDEDDMQEAENSALALRMMGAGQDDVVSSFEGRRREMPEVAIGQAMRAMYNPEHYEQVTPLPYTIIDPDVRMMQNREYLDWRREYDRIQIEQFLDN